MGRNSSARAVDFAGLFSVALSRDEMIQDNENDKSVNETGLQCPENVPCVKQCRPYIDALPPGSRSLMEKYLKSKANSFYRG
jgi:hypothetical protein